MLNTNAPAPNVARELAWTYTFPLVMVSAAIVPGCNYTYSGHGGFSWFVVPFCFPYVVARAFVKCFRGHAQHRAWFRRFFLITIPSYAVLALPLSWAAAWSIEHTFGLPIPSWAFFAVLVSPFPWYFFAHP